MQFVLGVALILIGAIAAWRAIRAADLARGELRWQAVTARVVSSTIRMKGEDFEPVVEYSYEYEGRKHSGNQIRSNLMTSESRDPANAEVSKYPPGADITVFVNPGDPRQSVIEAGGTKWYLTSSLVGCSLVAGGGLWLLWQSLSV